MLCRTVGSFSPVQLQKFLDFYSFNHCFSAPIFFPLHCFWVCDGFSFLFFPSFFSFFFFFLLNQVPRASLLIQLHEKYLRCQLPCQFHASYFIGRSMMRNRTLLNIVLVFAQHFLLCIFLSKKTQTSSFHTHLKPVEQSNFIIFTFSPLANLS